MEESPQEGGSGQAAGDVTSAMVAREGDFPTARASNRRLSESRTLWRGRKGRRLFLSINLKKHIERVSSGIFQRVVKLRWHDSK